MCYSNWRIFSHLNTINVTKRIQTGATPFCSRSKVSLSPPASFPSDQEVDEEDSKEHTIAIVRRYTAPLWVGFLNKDLPTANPVWSPFPPIPCLQVTMMPKRGHVRWWTQKAEHPGWRKKHVTHVCIAFALNSRPTSAAPTSTWWRSSPANSTLIQSTSE